ncbi:MAG: short-chain fatty acids transporter, partial [Pseudomonadales bacterium]
MSLSGLSDGFARVFKKLLPSPFGIAVSLTLFVFLVALCFLKPPEISFLSHAESLAFSWQEGLFQNNLLTFAFQMAFMLVLGHALALTKPFSQAIDLLTSIFCKNTALAAFGVTLLTVTVALFNWGLGLVFGAIFARKVGEYALQRKIPLNYPLIGAAGYSGLMVWHGGFSGSSLSKIAEPGELLSKAQGLTAEKLALVPEAISYDQTVFSTMNISISWALILILPAVMYWLGKRKPSEKTVRNLTPAAETTIVSKVLGAERMDHLSW